MGQNREMDRKTDRERAQFKRAYVRLFKESHRCEVCGEARTVCLDFHHRDPDSKKFSLSDAETYSIVRIDAEIKKCILVCANCHRVIHANDVRVAVVKAQEEDYPLFDLL